MYMYVVTVCQAAILRICKPIPYVLKTTRTERFKNNLKSRLK